MPGDTSCTSKRRCMMTCASSVFVYRGIARPGPSTPSGKEWQLSLLDNHFPLTAVYHETIFYPSSCDIRWSHLRHTLPAPYTSTPVLPSNTRTAQQPCAFAYSASTVFPCSPKVRFSGVGPHPPSSDRCGVHLPPVLVAHMSRHPLFFAKILIPALVRLGFLTALHHKLAFLVLHNLIFLFILFILLLFIAHSLPLAPATTARENIDLHATNKPRSLLHALLLFHPFLLDLLQTRASRYRAIGTLSEPRSREQIMSPSLPTLQLADDLCGIFRSQNPRGCRAGSGNDAIAATSVWTPQPSV
ncbi:unnamed protein product [Chondrus crispus]|uniref:Uncharacterized protein n=1 Tax=Chondrus crispus TaxID=2769 RepID=R7Q5L3_CHOCR|nr:unnamed protein product [Chondrus crispus]CDF33309.1 unnamed protein product [Chondrus crispus]|eukprot:XP_005713112.1 unnamed protein product [Chondrus crispus]